MPKVFEWNGHRFHFFANEGNPRESVHIHVSSAGAKAKFWLYPQVELAYNRGYDARTIRRIEEIVTERQAELEDCWNDFFA
jgi:Domain of unknown function (DUF4160)